MRSFNATVIVEICLQLLWDNMLSLSEGISCNENSNVFRSDTNFDFSASSVVDVFSGSSLVQTLTAQPHISAGILEFGSTIYVAGGEQRDSISGSKAFDVIGRSSSCLCDLFRNYMQHK